MRMTSIIGGGGKRKEQNTFTQRREREITFPLSDDEHTHFSLPL